ncbi:hypothetical protein RMATCC62417_18091 [Rhizopus microsporus]|nr:hypothetical protein RMATCC62417_18091 [Rhizopus microsporus]
MYKGFDELSAFVKNTKYPRYNVFILENANKIVQWSQSSKVNSAEPLHTLWAARFVRCVRKLRKGIYLWYVTIAIN